MNVHIEKIGDLGVLVYTHKAHSITQWRTYLLSEVGALWYDRAKAKQERIARKRHCMVKQVELDRPPWVADVLINEIRA